MANNPMTEIHRIDKPDEEKENVESRADFTESLNTYFELKTEYENHVYKMRKQVFKQAKTKKSARKQLALLKPKCINCNRPVGSIFTSEGRTYIARCGDAAAPCNLDIRLFAGEYSSLDSLLETFQETVQIYKENIIKQKLDALFNYITEREAVAIFKKEFEDFTESNAFLKELTTEYANIYFNEERKEKINRKMEQIARIRERITELFNKYKQTDNREVLKDAMTIYIQELKPEMENLQLLKYETIELDRKEIDKNNVLYELQQKAYRIDKVDFTFGTYPKVVRFRTKK
jgi:hypothetical protein